MSLEISTIYKKEIWINDDRWQESGILEFMDFRKKNTDQFVLNYSYWNILDLHIALLHINKASHTFTKFD